MRAKGALTSNPQRPEGKSDSEHNADCEYSLDGFGEVLSGYRAMIGMSDIVPMLVVTTAAHCLTLARMDHQMPRLRASLLAKSLEQREWG